MNMYCDNCGADLTGLPYLHLDLTHYIPSGAHWQEPWFNVCEKCYKDFKTWFRGHKNGCTG